MNVFNRLVSEIDKAVIDVSMKDSVPGAVKKDLVVKIIQSFYDKIDIEFNLPDWVDFSVKYVAIPIMIDFIYHELKSKKVI